MGMLFQRSQYTAFNTPCCGLILCQTWKPPSKSSSNWMTDVLLCIALLVIGIGQQGVSARVAPRAFVLLPVSVSWTGLDGPSKIQTPSSSR